MHYSWSGNPSIVCKKDVPIYNNVTQEDAKSIAKTFVNNDNVKSSLITGIQWDVVMGFVDQSQDGMNQIFDVKNPNPSRHIELLQYAGFNESDKVKNIYDLEGNVRELVAEIYQAETWRSHCYRRLDAE